MKKLLLISALLLVPVVSGAHEIKHTGTFDILLHMEPQDSPVARETGQLYFSITDSKEKFGFKDCDCSVVIKDSDNKELLNRKLTEEDEAPDWGVNVSRVSFVFPKLGIYKVTIEGKSKTNLFSNFSLDYDVRIDRESESQPATDPLPESTSLRNYYIIGGTVIVFGIIIYELFSRSRKKNK
ncbi:MAG: hypothetical protein KW793_03130 [Candidatus Doudnabacteria bacterium]|nr:hypothetical protein [Candidatus Doudnabacteria bacterium]